ncbi:MAG: glycosyltransferase family 4 protein, partial [Microthrixaceae bacterium]|nr:glycosyltransferase family 4 protein [Microthrixaceae bacterium]
MRRGPRPTVVTYGDEPGPSEARRSPSPVYRIPRSLPTVSRLALFAREVWRRGRDADLLFVNDYGLPATLANLLLRKPLVIKIVGDFAWEYSVRHGLIPPDEPFEQFQRSRYSPKVETLRLMQSTYVRAATRVLVPSSFVQWYVEGWGADPGRVRVVRNAVSDPTASIVEDRAALRTRLGVVESERVILVVARLTAWKGVDTVIAALGGLLEEAAPTARLVVVGDGPDRPRLESLAATLPAGAVRFTGELPRAEVGSWLKAADTLALCSGYEGLSHVLLEAMAAGLPVVASDVGGNRALVQHGVDGLLVPYGDVEATQQALASVLTDAALATRLSTAARQGAAERTVDRMVDEVLAVFREALEERRPSPPPPLPAAGEGRATQRPSAYAVHDRASEPPVPPLPQGERGAVGKPEGCRCSR